MTQCRVSLSVIILPWIALLAGCAAVKTSEELIGEYRARLPGGEATLVLLPGGECTQEIHLKSRNQSYSASGRWQYDPKNGYLSLEGTRLPLNGFGKLNPDIATVPAGYSGVLPVGWTLLHGIEIGTSEGTLYRKQRPRSASL